MRLPVVASKAIGHLALSLLLLNLQHGSQAEEPDCKMLVVKANSVISLKRPFTCGQCWPSGSRDQQDPEETDEDYCAEACDERIADFIYDTAKYRCDPCMHIRMSSNLSEWDVLFRVPHSRVDKIKNVATCRCSVTMVVQRFLRTPPAESLHPASPIAPLHCSDTWVRYRMVTAPLRLMKESWYPALRKTSKTSNSHSASRQDGRWVHNLDLRVLAHGVADVDCNAGMQDLHNEEDVSDYISPKKTLDVHSNCTIKYAGRGNPLWGNLGLRCDTNAWVGIRKRLESLYQADKDGKTHLEDVIKKHKYLRDFCVSQGYYAALKPLMAAMEDDQLLQPAYWGYGNL
ncbi:hypothetical protein BCR37DRAFT_381600 [Protomyces lactucae-debilis]|uniref:Uncharacterized protein n=1 Tax=Protomyces lactucae-debilis TaxID=2754530 RepID=A0A1Y2F702_PROLT|nr:uncharacterized protein BCR37DRAFT_381600 [Protomyces lactucae-debilis]ORY79437.1 hypothetical protein BCR37DRAFT_381600 [Protomyces lactucae-debilis]